MSKKVVCEVRADYWVHMLMLMPCFVLLKKLNALKNLQIVMLCLVMAIFFESLQLLVPYRRFNFFDVFANVFGAMLGWLLYEVYLVVKRKI